MVLIEDSNYNKEWIRVDTRKDLIALEYGELRKILGEKIIIGQDDKVYVGNIVESQHVVI